MPFRTTLGCLSLALLLGGAALLPRSAAAEVGATPPEAPRSVVHEVFVDLGTFADRVPWHYVVRDGDSLGRIAERELGAVRRQREIEALNPGLKPRALRPGKRLFMPPRACLGTAGGSWCAFFAYAPDPAGWSAPRRLDGGGIHRVGDGARVFAVPCRRLSSLLEATRDGLVDGGTLLDDGRIPRSEPVTVVGSVSPDDPTRRIVTRYTVTAIDGGRVELAQAGEARFDAAGRTVAGAQDPRRRPSIALQSLALFAMLGLLGWLVNRSRPVDEAAAAPAPDDERQADEEPWAEAEPEDEAWEDDEESAEASS